MKKEKYEIFISGETVDLVIPNKNAIESDKLFIQDFFSLFHKWVSKLLQTDVGLMNESSQKKKDMAKEFSRCHFAIR